MPEESPPLLLSRRFKALPARLGIDRIVPKAYGSAIQLPANRLNEKFQKEIRDYLPTNAAIVPLLLVEPCSCLQFPITRSLAFSEVAEKTACIHLYIILQCGRAAPSAVWFFEKLKTLSRQPSAIS